MILNNETASASKAAKMHITLESYQGIGIFRNIGLLSICMIVIVIIHMGLIRHRYDPDSYGLVPDMVLSGIYICKLYFR